MNRLSDEEEEDGEYLEPSSSYPLELDFTDRLRTRIVRDDFTLPIELAVDNAIAEEEMQRLEEEILREAEENELLEEIEAFTAWA